MVLSRVVGAGVGEVVGVPVVYEERGGEGKSSGKSMSCEQVSTIYDISLQNIINISAHVCAYRWSSR